MIESFRKLLLLIGSEHRSRWVVLALFAATVSVLDAVAAVLVYSVLQVLLKPTENLDLPVLGDVGRLFPNLDADALLLFGAVIVATVFVLRSLAYVVQVHLQHRTAHNAGADIAKRLVRAYLLMPYSYHLDRNSAELIRNAFDAVQRLAGEVLASLIRLASDTLIILAIIAVLFASAPLATLFLVGVFAPTVWLTLAVMQPRLKRIGRTAQDMARTTLQSLQQGLGAIRDIKLLGRERYFVTVFDRHRRRLARARYLRATALELPRVIIETVLVIVVCAFLAFSATSGRPLEEALSVLGLFAYAAFRTLPALSSILAQLNSLKFTAPTIDDLARDLQFLEQNAEQVEGSGAGPSISLSSELTIEDVSFRYEGADREAVSNVSLRIPKGSSLGIVGPSGGGKTTLVDIICGLLTPTRGCVRVDGQDIAENRRGWQSRLGVVPQTLFLLDESLRANVAFGLPDDEIDGARLRAAVELAQLDEFVASSSAGLDTVVGERGIRISGGQRQRIAIARSLYHDPEVLIFDEATSALDSVTERAFLLGVLQRVRGRTLIMVAHRIATVRDCDRIVIVDDGRVIDSGTFAELHERSSVFRGLAAGAR